ncbi:HesA/MoeB/ThiF family protein [Paracoccus jiaweipingae]|uniref:HesA/MoeB/ThiF family protein n=1 Tax=unclassified Paracoccus (in: a-proteobacteria) TaxID=2688777 RepID=UPI0037929717
MAVVVVLAALALVWFGGAALGVAPRLRGLAMLALWGAVLALVGLAPASGLGRWLGGSVQGWLVGGGVLALALAYRWLVRLARARAVPQPVADAAPLAAPAPAAFDPEAPLSDAELDRYARHIMLRELGGPGQRALRRARVLVVGAGGLGSPVSLYLAAAGVGRLTLADDDTVSLSNLQRQILFATGQEGQPKAQAGADRLRALNPQIQVTPLPRRITAQDADFLRGFDLVIDGTDSFAGRQAINAACVAAGVPLLAGAIAQWEGQITVYDPARGAPCLSCLFPQAPAPGSTPSCAEAGVIGALPGVIGAMMALEAVKLLTGAGQDLRGRMMIYDGLYADARVMRLSRRADCAVCGTAT